jgi:23S rRNA (pseudouridine1915-N3)-methyltransferase
MLHIVFLMVGKTRAKFIQEGMELYVKRLQSYVKLSLLTVREEKPHSQLSDELIREREGARLLAQLPRPGRLVVLEASGKEMTSEGLARWLTELERTSSAPLVFVVGGHLGLAPAVIAAANDHLSLSRFTFTHEMSRLILLEQLYRAATIRAGHPYHN